MIPRNASTTPTWAHGTRSLLQGRTISWRFSAKSRVLPDERFSPEANNEHVGKLISTFLRNQKEGIEL